MLLAWLCQASTIEEEVEKLQWSALWGARRHGFIGFTVPAVPLFSSPISCLLSHPLKQV